MIPSIEECEAILQKAGTPLITIEHGKKVAAMGRKIANSLNEKGMQLDVELIMAAGRLHDLAKGQPNHAQVGSDLLSALGYAELARLVAEHMDIEFEEDSILDESAVLHLADKLVKKDRIVTIHERFKPLLEKFPPDDPYLPTIKRRHLMARRIAKSVEQTIGSQLAVIVEGDL